MSNPVSIRIAYAFAAVLAASAASSESPDALNMDPVNEAKQVHLLPKPPHPKPHSLPLPLLPATPKDEPNVITTASASSLSRNLSPNDTTLSPPVTLTYAGSSNAFTITDSGTGRGLSSTVTNANSGSSALFGSTVGTGAGLTGYNGGTSGPGGKFEVTNANSTQAGVFATTNGQGSAILATNTNTGTAAAAAVLGESTSVTDNGIGVEGMGTSRGVYGLVPGNNENPLAGTVAVQGTNDSTSTDNIGVMGYSSIGFGVGASSDESYGLEADSNSSYAVYATTTSGASAMYAANDSSSSSAYAVYGTVASGNAIEGVATANAGYGVDGQSINGIGVRGEDTGSGIGVYGTSNSGYAGDFAGNVEITGTLTVGSTVYSSDRNLKTDVLPIDGKDLLDRIGHLQISSWNYKTDPNKRHVGPMAQDFHAAFGLDGDDDKHINEVDIAGVSLAAIQELHLEVQQKDSQIADLKTQLAAQSVKVSQIEQQFSEMRSELAALQTQSNTVAMR